VLLMMSLLFTALQVSYVNSSTKGLAVKARIVSIEICYKQLDGRITKVTHGDDAYRYRLVRFFSKRISSGNSTQCWSFIKRLVGWRCVKRFVLRIPQIHNTYISLGTTKRFVSMSGSFRAESHSDIKRAGPVLLRHLQFRDNQGNLHGPYGDPHMSSADHFEFTLGADDAIESFHVYSTTKGLAGIGVHYTTMC
jgi:hypothetical protein